MGGRRGHDDYASFGPSAADYGAVALFTIVWTMLMVYALLREGITRSVRGVLEPSARRLRHAAT
jgi:hypothetical protein